MLTACPSFTENPFKDNMLEMEIPRDESPVMTDLSLSDKHALVQLYRETVSPVCGLCSATTRLTAGGLLQSSGILDLFTVAEVRGFLDRHTALSPSNVIEEVDKRARAEQAALNMMLAIGHQCRGHNMFDVHNAARSFSCAQKYAFEGFLCDPSLDMVRVFLLMAFYMLGACHRNAAFMYLGIASKAACALGLHRQDQYKDLSDAESLARWRTWKSLLVLDTIVSSILGRPGGLPAMRPDDDTAYDGDGEVGKADRPRWLASRAVFGICSHIIELEQQLGSGQNMDAQTADAFLQRLRKWNDSVPTELRHFASLKDTLGPADRELFIGATHVACSYYFTIILVTRPFLISHLISQIRKRRKPSLESTITATTAEQQQQQQPPSAVSDLAQACLDSAIFMSKTGYMSINSSILSNNMCLLKAWMFAAGLLLGFSMFAHSEESSSSSSSSLLLPDVDEAFHNAIAVLERLASVSPQARHYLEILRTLSDAIVARREQVGREQRRRKRSNPYVSQIFTAEFCCGGGGRGNHHHHHHPPVPATAAAYSTSTTTIPTPNSSHHHHPHHPHPHHVDINITAAPAPAIGGVNGTTINNNNHNNNNLLTFDEFANPSSNGYVDEFSSSSATAYPDTNADADAIADVDVDVDVDASWNTMADPLLSDGLYIDWETLWPMERMMM